MIHIQSRVWRGLFVTITLSACLAATAATTTRVSVAGVNTQVGGPSDYPSVSADGRYVAFVSSASKLVPGDTNGMQDVFWRDTVAGVTRRVSVSTAGEQADAPSYSPSISGDGRYVAFMSGASNLIANDANIWNDVYLHDCTSGQTILVSKSSTGNQGNDDSYSPAISADGRYVAFVSMSDNLVTGDNNWFTDIFVRDLVAGQTTMVSVADNGALPNDWSFDPSISSDGRKIAFTSYATNLVSGDTNGYLDVFVRDRVAGTTVRVSRNSAGVQGNYDSQWPSMSGGGRYVAFESGANNLVTGDTNKASDVFLHDLNSGTTTRVSLTNADRQAVMSSGKPAVSADGRYIAFASESALVSNDTNRYNDVFVRDRFTGTTSLVSVATDGTPGDGDSSTPVITPEGRYVVFVSAATTLVTGDTNGVYDLFRRDRGVLPTPKVTAYTPKGTAVARKANITVTFSLNMAHSSVQNALTINGKKASAFGGAFTWDGRKLIFNPTALLVAGRTYKVVVGTGAKSAQGQPLAKAQTWSFTVAAATAPAVSLTALPTAFGAQLQLHLAAAAEVTVTIRNLAGREIAVLQPGTLEAGTQTLLWNGRSRSGTLATPGVYLLQVTARGEDGATAAALATLRR